MQQSLQGMPPDERDRVNLLLDQVNRLLQKNQREAGRTFVSRTRLRVPCYGLEQLTVLRVVLANPLTTDAILSSVLDEQCELVRQDEIRTLLQQVEALCAASPGASPGAAAQAPRA